MKYNVTITTPAQQPETIYGVTMSEAYKLQASRLESSVVFRPQLWLSKPGDLYTIDYVTESVGITVATARTVLEAETILERYQRMTDADLHAAIMAL